MREGVGVGGVVSSIGWITERENGCVAETKLVEHLQIRFGVSRDRAEFAIKLAEKCGAVERKDGKVRVKKRTLRPV